MSIDYPVDYRFQVPAESDVANLVQWGIADWPNINKAILDVPREGNIKAAAIWVAEKIAGKQPSRRNYQDLSVLDGVLKGSVR